MLHLRTRIEALRERLGPAGFTLAIIALIVALAGSAYAASGALTGKQKKEVKAIAKSFAGKNGAPGANGTNGTNGAPGEKGAPGTNGADGKDGNSVSVNSYTGQECEEAEGEEGAEFTNATGTAYACNGKEGSPWTVGGVLPPEQTLQGTWGAGGSNQFQITAPISFNIPLSGPLAEANVHFASNASGEGDLTASSATVSNVHISVFEPPFVAGDAISGTAIPAGTHITKVEVEKEEALEIFYELTLSANATAPGTGVSLTATPPAACPGTVGAPQAEEGNLCVYVQTAVGVVRDEAGFFPGAMGIHGFGGVGANPFGAEVTARAQPTPILFPVGEAPMVFMEGSWAVTAG